MRFVISWIGDFVELPGDHQKLARDLSMAGMAIDALEKAENGEAVLDADITTNRPDQMNHYGMAREAAAIYDRPLKPGAVEVRESQDPATKHAQVEIADPDLCARYSARVIRNVKVGPSPEWMVRRLEAAGLRSINNVADITNYLLLELGHPLHAFDLDTLAGRRIIVRRARAGEKMMTLDGMVREFNAGNLVIADAEKPVAIAGVMGGEETGIHEHTTNVLLESAWFDPLSVRRTSRQFGMHTDASHRFERGADVNITGVAADRAAEMMRALAGGEVCRGLIDVFPAPRHRPSLILRNAELLRILGAPVPAEEVQRILRGLAFRVAPDGGRQWIVEPPSFRLDIEREIDVIEEVARLYGYNNFPNRLPAWAGVAHRGPNYEEERLLRTTALALGYTETMSFSLIAPREAEQFSSSEPVRLANPLSEEASVMRTSMVPGAVNAIERNLNRGLPQVRLFEVGKIYQPDGNAFAERAMLVLAATGAVTDPSVHAAARDIGFFDIKGDVETLLDLFSHRHVYYDGTVGVDYYHPGRAARAVVDGETVARLGELHPRIVAARKLRQPVMIAELMLDRLFKRGLRQPAYSGLARVPAVERDLSLLVPEGVAFERIWETVQRAGVKELVDVRPIEIFRGGQVTPGRYSLLLRLVFQNPRRTLSDAEVNEWSRALTASLQEQLGAVLRS